MIERLVWTPELVARFWDGLAQTRLLELAFSKLAGPYLYMMVRQYLSETGRHLDFGAGDGDFVRLLVDHGVAAAAYEPSLARQATIWSRVDGRFPFLGCVGPDYRGSPFDVIFLFEVVEHILDGDLGETFTLLDRLLAPDGKLIITTPNVEDLELASVVDPRGEVLFHRWQHVRSLTAESLSQLLERFGFSLIVTHEIEISDRVFAAREGGLASRPELANLFNTYRPLLIGNRERLVGVAARRDVAGASRADLGLLDDWSRAPVVVGATTTLQLPDCPRPNGNGVAGPHPPHSSGADVRHAVCLDPERMRHDSGNCWVIELDGISSGDSEAEPRVSALELYEDWLPLGPRHAQHDSIRDRGRGRFSHWGSTLFFSASDNGDPRRNGRRYVVASPAAAEAPVHD